MTPLRVRCPAKINTFLSVGPPDAIGYHPVRTVFQAVDLCDELLLENADDDAFVCDWPLIPADNTVTKAWRLAREYVGLPRLRVTLNKRIPAESGLGGGSSDAAGLLRGLVRLTKGRFLPENAAEVARAVGSDVPFFLVGGSAKGEGYGDILTSLPDGPTRHFVIVRPEVGVSTPSAYRALDARARAWREFPTDPTSEMFNDFEPVAPPECRQAASDLKDVGAMNTLLCGSGSAVFGLFADEDQADTCLLYTSRCV